MKLKVAAVAAGLVLTAGLATSAYAGGCQYDNKCPRNAHFCGYAVGTVPAGECAKQPVKPDSQFCGYQVGTVPAGKCTMQNPRDPSEFCGYMVGTYPAGKCVTTTCQHYQATLGKPWT